MSVELTRAEEVPGTEVTSLVQLAIEQNVSVDILERLVALQERVTERNARGAFFAALAAFQENCPEIRKSRTAQIATKSGAKYSYTYAPLEEITRTIRPGLKQHGFSYTWNVRADGKCLIVVCVLRHVEGHAEEAEFPVPVDTAAAMSDAQKNGAALTYGKRQSLLSVLGLTTADEDVDGAAPGTSAHDYITDPQAADLSALLDEVGADRTKFLQWIGAPSLAEIPAKDYQRAVRALEAKRSA